MKNKKQKTDEEYASELMLEYYGPIYGSGIKKKRK